jgi:hypothetical protein
MAYIVVIGLSSVSARDRGIRLDETQPGRAAIGEQIDRRRARASETARIASASRIVAAGAREGVSKRPED